MIFLSLTLMFSKLQWTLRITWRREIEIETVEFSKNENSQKKAIYEDFFTSNKITELLQFLFCRNFVFSYSKSWNATCNRWRCSKKSYPWKQVHSFEKQNFRMFLRNYAVMLPKFCEILFFDFMVPVVSMVQFLWRNSQNSWKMNFFNKKALWQKPLP